MIARATRIALLIAGLAGAQALALAVMVGDRILLLTGGREIIAPVEPVDPRSLFRGDYVDLGYSFARTLPALHPHDVRRATTVYVTLEQLPDGTLRATDVGYRHPGAVDQGKVVLRGTLAPSGHWRRGIRFGIEKYFVPEATGPRLEQLARDRKLAVALAVDRRGRAAIKGLVIDGVRIYDEPLF